MRINLLRVILPSLSLVGALARADEFSWLGDFSTNLGDAVEYSTLVPFAPRPGVFDDFQSRLEAAVAGRDPLAIRALYQINGVAADDLRLEFARWQQQSPSSVEATVSLVFKELSTLPPEARDCWTKIAQGLTKCEVTHLVGVWIRPGVAFRLFPLVLIGEKLWIVPSDVLSNTPVAPMSVLSAPTSGSMTEAQAHAFAKQLATAHYGWVVGAGAFDQSAPPHLGAGRWRWRWRHGSAQGDVHVSVSFAEDGSSPEVLWDFSSGALEPWAFRAPPDPSLK